MSTARDFHEQTKYAPDTIGDHPGLDWANKPEPFKGFRSQERIDLGPSLRVVRDPLTEQPKLATIPEEKLSCDASVISTLLLHGNGVTAMMRDVAGQTHLFRAAPSAGALYPTEIYVATRGIEGIPDGIYDYQVSDHALAPVCDGDFLDEIRVLAFDHPALAEANCVMLFGAVFARSAWRYLDRAYRRILLDTGHIVGNVAAIAPELDHQLVMIPDFDDAAIGSLLMLDADQEAILTLGAVLPLDTAATSQPLLRSSPRDAGDDRPLLAVHRAGYLSGAESSPEFITLPAMPPGMTIPLPEERVDWGDKICETILLRRSSREFTGGPIPLEELTQLLRHAYAPRLREQGPDSSASFAVLPLLRTWLIVNNITGLEGGVYAFDPIDWTLVQVRAGSFRKDCHQVTLGQDLGEKASCIVVHTADLDAATNALGDRAYRHLSLDAGQIGERLNLAASRLGLGVSGIGGYFDDLVCDLLGVPHEEAVVYLTCLGQPPQEF